MEKLKCEYCNEIRQDMIFCIGASNEPDWVMNEGTGKVSCPKCYTKGRQEGQKAIDRHIKSFQ